MIAILWVKVLIFQGAKPIFNVGSLSYIFILFSLPILSSPKSLILWTFSLNSYLKNRAKSDEQSLYLVLNSQKWV